MGSFNYNLHVKCDDPARVAAAIGQLLAQDGWRKVDESPGEKLPRPNTPAGSRGLWVSTPVYGWVSVLDADVAGAMSLATPLAEQLDAYTLLYLVNDSDSWMYSLSRGDGLLDEFDSAGEGGVPDELSDEALAQYGQSMQNLQAKMADGTLQGQIERWHDEIVAQAPTAIQEMYRRIQAGQATPQEMTEYQAWSAVEAPKHAERIRQMIGEFFQMPGLAKAAKGTGKPKKRKRKPTKAQREAALQRIDNLRPLFVAGVSDERLQEVLDERTTFAEETLAKFLPLVGIPGFYAYLDYDHKEEASPEELAAHGIQFAHHLVFHPSEP